MQMKSGEMFNPPPRGVRRMYYSISTFFSHPIKGMHKTPDIIGDYESYGLAAL